MLVSIAESLSRFNRGCVRPHDERRRLNELDRIETVVGRATAEEIEVQFIALWYQETLGDVMESTSSKKETRTWYRRTTRRYEREEELNLQRRAFFVSQDPPSTYLLARDLQLNFQVHLTTMVPAHRLMMKMLPHHYQIGRG